IPRSPEINYYEDQGMTVIEGDPELEISLVFRKLAASLLKAENAGEDKGESSMDQKTWTSDR
ncbi:MAG: hypothetical protein PUB22_02025, partial [Clostridiales bacterium]|nr:hypothetical protein [Clostridiales bacterium]